MRPTLWLPHRSIFNHLTVIKLALQIADRKTALSSYQRDLLRTALTAADELTADLLAAQHAAPPLAQRHPDRGLGSRPRRRTTGPALTLRSFAGCLARLGWGGRRTLAR